MHLDPDMDGLETETEAQVAGVPTMEERLAAVEDLLARLAGLCMAALAAADVQEQVVTRKLRIQDEAGKDVLIANATEDGAGQIGLVNAERIALCHLGVTRRGGGMLVLRTAEGATLTFAPAEKTDSDDEPTES